MGHSNHAVIWASPKLIAAWVRIRHTNFRFFPSMANDGYRVRYIGSAAAQGLLASGDLG